MLEAINFLFGTNITASDLKPFIYFVGVLLAIIFIYYLLYKRLGRYAKLRNMGVEKMWSKADQIMGEDASGIVTNMRMERLKEKHVKKIEQARRQRDLILKYVPFMNRIYERTLKKPLFLIRYFKNKK